MRTEVPMRVAGVFVGLSAQLDTGIRALGFGARDAIRLHAAFADSNEAAGGQDGLLHLLTNENATLEATRSALEAVVRAAENGSCEIVYIHFSCHGSPGGELVLYDTMRRDVAGTGIPLNEISERLANIRGAGVVITLDSCFSGTVLGLPHSPNAMAFEALMLNLSGGDTRAVVWAAHAQEAAYEAPVLGNGYLSHGLLYALERARGAGQSTIATTVWLHQAIERAQELLVRDGYPQNPAGHLRTRSGAMVPVPPLGSRQRQFAIDEGVRPVSEAVSSLEVYGFTTAEFEAIERRLGGGATLNLLQREAISPGGVLAGSSLLVRAPTTAGKTLIGELTILRHWREGRKAIVLSPMRALVNEQAAAFALAYGPLGLHSVKSTGEHTDDDDLVLGNQFDVAFFTYEKFAAMLSLRPNLLDSVGVVVADEIQLITEADRGGSCELLLLRLRRRQRDGLPQLLAFCGEVTDLGGLDAWLGLRVIATSHRPIPLRDGVITPDGTFRFVSTATGTSVGRERVPLPARVIAAARGERDVRAAIAYGLTEILLGRHQRVLLFVTSQPRALKLGVQLATGLGLGPHEELCTALEALPDGDRHRTTQALIRAANGGVGIHTKAMEPEEHRAVENAFRTGDLRVLVATPTLAMGVNTPADTVIVVDNEFYRGQAVPPDPLDRRMYRNMAGRAGRVLPNGPQEGTAYLVAHNAPDGERLWHAYVEERSQVIGSTLERLQPDDRFVAFLGILGQGGLQDIVDLSRQTLRGHQSAGNVMWATEERRRFEEIAPGLMADGLIEEVGPRVMRITSLGQVASALILQVESVRRVRRAVRAITDAGEPLDDLALIVLTQLTVELESETIFVPGDALAPSAMVATAPKARFAGRGATFAALTDARSLGTDPVQAVGRRFRRLAGVIDWLQGKDLGEVEARYFGGDSRPTLSYLRAAATRAEDVLLGVIAIVVAERPELADALRSQGPRLRSRLEVGGGVEAGRLYRLRLNLTRRQCLKLVRMGIRTEAELRIAVVERRSDLEQLLSSPGLHALLSKLEMATRRPRQLEAPDQLLLDLLQGGSEL
jgi:ATP-dependent DNA helicase